MPGRRGRGARSGRLPAGSRGRRAAPAREAAPGSAAGAPGADERDGFLPHEGQPPSTPEDRAEPEGETGALELVPPAPLSPSPAVLVQLASAGLGAGVAAAVRRLRRGRRRPGWRWRVEMLVAVQRAVLRRLALRDPALAQALTQRPALPLSRLAREASVTAVRERDVRGEWVEPREGAPQGAPVVLYLHGGAYVFGSAAGHRELTARLARASGARVLSLDYRLAPRHPFPAALEDAQAAWTWLRAQGVAPRRLVVAGDSAGGGLALALLLRLRDQGDPLPAGAALLCPWVDLGCSRESVARNAPTDVLHAGMLRTWSAHYRGDVDPRHPWVSPVHADLHGLPPLLIQTGGAETLLDEGAWLDERAREAGTEVELAVAEDMFHGWHLCAAWVPEGVRAIDEVARFVRRRAGTPRRAVTRAAGPRNETGPPGEPGGPARSDADPAQLP